MIREKRKALEIVIWTRIGPNNQVQRALKSESNEEKVTYSHENTGK